MHYTTGLTNYFRRIREISAILVSLWYIWIYGSHYFTGTQMDTEIIIEELKRLSRPGAREGMARFGINVESALGVSIPDLRKLAKTVGKSHPVALALWKSGIHDARILASMVDSHKLVTEKQMDGWVKDFNSWDLCDQTCNNLFWNTDFAWKKIHEWAVREEEFVKRAAFALIACVAWHAKNIDDSELLALLPLIREASVDERNFVKKAVNWALRHIGKRSVYLNPLALEFSYELLESGSKPAVWIAKDAIRELESAAVRKRLGML